MSDPKIVEEDPRIVELRYHLLRHYEPDSVGWDLATIEAERILRLLDGLSAADEAKRESK